MSRGLELNLFTLLENRHCETRTWKIKEELSKVLIIRVFLSDFSTHYKFHNEALFGRRMTPGEQLKKNQRALYVYAGAGQGAAGEDHRRHQEDGQAGADGHCQNNGQGEIRTISSELLQT